MAFPTPKVYIAFDDGPYVTSPTWTDVSAYVFSADVNRGRADDYSNVVGTASVVLNNNTRLFDPFNTAGTYYGKLLPRRQIKIEAISGATTFAVFRGFIAAWPAQFNDAGKTGTVSLQCFDALALMAQEQLPDSVFDYTKTLSPVHYYRFDDPIGQGFLTDIGSRPQNLFADNTIPFFPTPPYSKTSGIVPALSTEATQITGAGYNDVGDTTTRDTSISVSTWIVLSGTSTFLGFDCRQYQARLLTNLNVSTDVLEVWGQTATFLYKATLPSSLLTGTGAVHLAATLTAGAFYVYINGTDYTGTITTTATGLTSQEMNDFYGPQLQEASVYNYVLTPAQIANLYNYGVANIVETSSARFNRLVGFTSFPSALTSATATPVATVGNLSSVGTNLASELAIVNNSEGGVLYVSKAGTVTFTDRNFVYTNTKSNTVQATLATGTIGYEPQVSIEYSGDQLRNVYQVNFTGGGTTTASNTASVTAYGRNTTTLDTQLSTFAQAQTLAAYEALVGGQLLSDTSPVKVGVAGATADWTTLLGLELFERYTITVNPSTGSAFSQTQLINSIRHSIVPGKYEMTLDGSARYSSWFMLDKSLLDGPEVLQ